MVDEMQLRQRIAQGELIERPDEMTPAYRDQLLRMMLIAGDTEFMSVPFLYSYFETDFPSRFLRQLIAVIQDEFGHAQIDYRLCEDLGMPVEQLIYERDISEFRYPYMFDMPVEHWAEAALVEGLGEYAGGILVQDVLDYSSYAPWRRALAKTLVEETFHTRFGKAVLQDATSTAEGKRAVQKALDWEFPLFIEWFGPADTARVHQKATQNDYRLKGHGNDVLRQQWMEYSIPLLNSMGLDVPAHLDKASGKYVLDFPFPCHFEPEKKKWDFSRPVEWSAVFDRWKARGPMGRKNLDLVRQGYRSLRQLEEAA
jgi:ring-1,2-phenylacetyl-CoA epoxidase subunit PaaA